jgi:hypothetical protein
MQQMEHDFMASENPPKQTATERKPADARSRPQPSQPAGPPLLQNGLETPRDSHC